jgi:signal transduction histidine kinase
MPVPIPADEEGRLRVLQALRILDTPAEEAYDQITRLAAHVCDMPVALVTFVDADRQWFKSRYGLALQQTTRESAFCAYAIAGQVLVVDDALADARFANNPLVVAAPFIRAYAGIPVRVDGQPIGTLCVIDRRPRRIGPEQLFALRTLARQVEVELRLRRALCDLEEDRRRLDRVLTVKRDLITLIVHDLKSPLAAVMLGASVLLDEGQADVRSARLIRQILLSADTMNRLVLDLLDLARFDEGAMYVHRVPVDLTALLQNVRERFELQAAAQGRVIHWTIPDGITAEMDRDLVRRVVENLLDNALKFAPAGDPIDVAAGVAGDRVVLTVRDRGTTIPEVDRERIFARWEGEIASSSRGLGLSFCRMAAEAHGGSVIARPSPGGGNEFVVSIPQRVAGGERPA